MSHTEWEALKAACAACTRCSLSLTRTNAVFGKGSGTAKILFVGEAPGEQEDLSGTPFVGRAGKLLDALLDEAGIPREEIYIANILKCRPPENRDPLPSETDACLDYLFGQIRLLRPRAVVCLGRIAAARLIKKDFRITKEHGVWFEGEDYPITAIYHPAFVLRDPRKKGDVLADLAVIKEKLNEIL